MRFYKSEPFEVKSMFVPDMTPWDQILKAGEKQQEKFDKTEAEANALSALKLRGGFSTHELAAPEYNRQIDALANEASTALENNNLAGARASILKAKQLATSPEALTIKADEDFTMKNPNYVNELLTKDPTAVIPFMEVDQNTSSKKVKQANFAENFDPFQRYSFTPTGKGLLAELSEVYNSLHNQFTEKDINNTIIPMTDAKGNTTYINRKTGKSVEYLDEPFLRNYFTENINQFNNINVPTFAHREAQLNKKLTPEEKIDMLVDAGRGKIFSKENLTQSDSKISNSNNKTQGELIGTPTTGEQSDLGKTVRVTNSDNTVTDKVPVKIEDLDNGIQTENHYDVMKAAVKDLGGELKITKDGWLKALPNQLDGATTRAIAQILTQNGVSEEDAVTHAPYIKTQLDFSTANRRDIEINKDNAIKTVQKIKGFENLTPGNLEVIKAKKEAEKQAYQEIRKILALSNIPHASTLPLEDTEQTLADGSKTNRPGLLSYIQIPQYKQAYQEAYEKSLKTNGRYGKYLTAIDNEVKSQYEKNKFLQGYDLKTLERDDTKQKVGDNLKIVLEGDLDLFSLSDISGTSNEKIKNELSDARKGGDIKYNASSIYYDPTKDKYIAKVTVTSESKGYIKNIYADVTETVRSQDPSTNNSSLLNTKWDNSNKISHKYYNDVYSKLKNNIPQEFTLDGTKFKITKFPSDTFTIVVNGKPISAGNFNELVTQIILNKSNTPTSGGGDGKKQNFFSSRT